jgi:transposase
MNGMVRVGIDVSSRTLDVAIEGRKGPIQERVFANDARGHGRLIQELKRSKSFVRVCLEATGIYHLDLCMALVAAPRIEVMVVNPRAAKDFARAQLQRSKTDRVDARSLLEFASRMTFVPWCPPSQATLDLRALARRIQALLVNRAQERNRLHADGRVAQSTSAIQASIERHIEAINAEVDLLTKQALSIVRMDPRLARRFDHLVSVKGIAQGSAITILAELAVLPDDMSARQWVAHAGIDPRHSESGSSVRGQVRISKVGNRRLRSALFLPAMVAAHHEPSIQAYYRHLIVAGKKPIQAIVAVMRKLLHAIHAMFLNDQPFDGTKFFAQRA